MFEKDRTEIRTEEDQKYRDNLRKTIYTTWYNYDSYDWVMHDTSQSAPPMSSSSEEMMHKPYTPPTPFDPSSAKPFGEQIDAPLN